MFCHTCGTELTAGLSFCPRCGANLQPAKSLKALSASTEMLNVWLFVNTLCGFGIALGFMALMKEIGFDISLIILFTLLVFLTVILIDAVFIWQLLHLRRDFQTAKEINEAKESAATLTEAKTPLISPIPASVTELTTKNLDPVLETRKTVRS